MTEKRFKNAKLAAIALHKAGMYVFPLWRDLPPKSTDEKERGKIPAFPGWQKWALNATVQNIQSCGTANNYNWGVLCGEGVCVLDVDTKGGKDGIASLKAVEKIIGKLPLTFTVVTPTGGLHYYFKDPDGLVRNSAGLLGTGLDTRGKGGYVVAPESCINDLNYRISVNTKLALIPSNLVRLLQEKKAERTITNSDVSLNSNNYDQEIEGSIHAGEGLRDTALWDFCCFMRGQGKGAHYNVILAAARAFNETIFDEPKPDHIVESKARRACQYTPEEAKKQVKGKSTVDAFQDFLNEDPIDAEVMPYKKEKEEDSKAVDFYKRLCIAVKPASDIDPLKIPPIEWLVYGLFQKKKITIIIAAGGVGKSILMLQAAFSVASGINLIGLEGEYEIKEVGNVLYYNAEEETVDLERRVVAISQFFDAPRPKRLKLLGCELAMPLATIEDKHFVPNTEVITPLIKYIKDHEISLWIVDPFVRLSDIDENDNKANDALYRLLTRVASLTNCSIAVVDHANKASYSTSGESFSIRGASSKTDAAKVVKTLRYLDAKTECDIFYERHSDTGNLEGKEESYHLITEENRKSYFLEHSAKLSFAPNPEGARAYKHVNVITPNGDHIGIAQRVELTKNKPKDFEEIHKKKASQLDFAESLHKCMWPSTKETLAGISRDINTDTAMRQSLGWPRKVHVNTIKERLLSIFDAEGHLTVDIEGEESDYCLQADKHPINKRKTTFVIRTPKNMSLIES